MGHYPNRSVEESLFKEIDFFSFPLTYPGDCFVAVLLVRPDAEKMIQDVEYSLFNPLNEKKNEDFGLAVVKWSDFPWAIFAFPNEQFTNVQALALKHDFFIRQAIPAILDDKSSLTVLVSLPWMELEKQKITNIFPFPKNATNCFVAEAKSALESHGKGKITGIASRIMK